MLGVHVERGIIVCKSDVRGRKGNKSDVRGRKGYNCV